MDGQTRPLLLADAGGESSDAETVWKHGAADCGAVAASGVAEVMVTNTSVRKEQGTETCLRNRLRER
jgi:hypothetical protein